jgi:LDH2 family malate/lactate/ureidoglycolate dehydrogenase
MSNNNEKIVNKISYSCLTDLLQIIFLRCGMRKADAVIVAKHMISSDLADVPSHGILRLPNYVNWLVNGKVSAIATPTVVGDRYSDITIDGNNGMGHVTMEFGIKVAIERALVMGTASVAIKGSNHCGALASYARQVLTHDMYCIIESNALATMAPQGGSANIMGNNPICYVIPALNELPIIFDGAMSQCSHGQIRVREHRNQELPLGWVIDKNGDAITDPTQALHGILQPSGGYKGTALAFLSGFESSILSGGAFGTEFGSIDTGPKFGCTGHFIRVKRLDAHLRDAEDVKRDVDIAIQKIKSCPTLPGAAPVRLPGERALSAEQKNRRDGIPVDLATIADLRKVLESLNLSVPEFLL